MKSKLFLVLFWVLFFGLSAVAHADILGSHYRSPAQVAFQQNAKASGVQAVDPQTVLDNIAAVVNYLGARAGTIYIFTKVDRGWGSYEGATLYTLPWGLAFDVNGLTTVNGNGGLGTSLDYNIGSKIPAQGVPILSLLDYVYAGVGGGAIDVDGAWHGAGFVDIQMKGTF